MKILIVLLAMVFSTYSGATTYTCERCVPDYVYTWQSTEWSSCSDEVCGLERNQTRVVTCMRDDGVVSNDTFCSTPKPETTQKCDTIACTYSWVVGTWSACSVTACGQTGTQTRSVVCTKKEDGTTAADTNCTEAKPAASQACSTPVCPPPPTTELNVLDFGATPNDTTDDAPAINRAIAAVTATRNTVFIPKGNYMVNARLDANRNPLGIRLRSNMKLKMDPEAILTVIPNNQIRYYTVSVINVSNVEVFGGQLVGDRVAHVYATQPTASQNTHEWGYGVVVRGSRNVRVHDVKVKDMTGDGLIVSNASDDVTFENNLSTNNRRQALTVGGATNIKILRNELSFTNGTAPQYGIDIEPDSPSTASNILIEGNNIHDNKGGAVQAYFRTSDIVIKDNKLNYNQRGIYAADAHKLTITGNTIAHNRYVGIAVRPLCSDFTIDKNIFRNNQTVLRGVTNDTNVLTTVTGQNSTTADHIAVVSGLLGIKVLTNQYAR